MMSEIQRMPMLNGKTSQDTQEIHILDVPGSAMGRYRRNPEEMFSVKVTESHCKMMQEDEVVKECTETPLKQGQDGMSENEPRHEQLSGDER